MVRAALLALPALASSVSCLSAWERVGPPAHPSIIPAQSGIAHRKSRRVSAMSQLPASLLEQLAFCRPMLQLHLPKESQLRRRGALLSFEVQWRQEVAC